MGIRKCMKNRDMFGYPVTLNFNLNGDSFTSVLGGLISVLTNLVLIWYCLVNVNIMVTRTGDTIIT